MYKCYPDAKRAHLKSGGNFPYLSRSTEVDLMIQVSTACIYMYNIRDSGRNLAELVIARPKDTCTRKCPTLSARNNPSDCT